MQSGGYDYEFVHTPSDTLICQICHCPSREPHLSACCGHIFCKSCLEAAVRVTSVTKACPMCRSKEFVTIPNKQADRIIMSLLVYCSNKNKGCKWKGEVRDITSHLSNSDGCQFHEVNCSNDCGAAYQRQYLTIHVLTECPRRKVNCHYCHDTGEHQFIEGQHKTECPKFPLPCPNNCGFGNIPRDGIREHVNICPLQLVQCKYHIIGCEVTMARKDQKKHNNEMMEEHLSLAVIELSATKKCQHDSQKTIQDLANKLATAEKEIVALKQQLDSNNKALAEEEMKCQSKVTVVEEAKQKSNTTNLRSLVWSNHLDNQAAVLISGNQVLPVVVKMSEFTEKKRQKIKWFSEPFYTHSYGYKMVLSVTPNGLSACSHMTVGLYVMQGPYDGQLKWPMNGEYEVALLNQFSNSSHHSVIRSVIERNSNRPTAERNVYASWYCKLFISHHALATLDSLVNDDTMYFQVSKLS